MMAQKHPTCDGQTFKRMAEAGKLWLEHNYERVNELNVFPVPDGDTGTNMLLTMSNAFKEIEADSNNSVAHIARRLAHGAMMGSRGNSGTIMSQIWIGFSQGLGVAETFDPALASNALTEASRKARQGVQKPIEGTILTVMSEIAEEAATIHQDTADMTEFFNRLVRRGWDAVARTPEKLDILRQAGVVDSGGAGLVYILEGMSKYLSGEPIEAVVSLDKAFEEAVSAFSHDFEDSAFNYDVQFVIQGEGLDVLQIKNDIEAMGDSGVIIGHERLVKVHIHVDDPGVPISYAVKLGILMDVVVENMQAQYEALRDAAPAKPEPLKLHQVAPGEIGVVAVTAGEGLSRVFAELGVAGLVNGGQTNNPSTEEIVNAVRGLGTDKVIILPNNKNIILAAEQAAKLCTDIQVSVIPTRTVPQGIAAMLPYRPNDELAEVAEEMTESRTQVVTGEITVATRSVELDGVKVESGQIIGLVDGKLRIAGDDMLDVLSAVMDEADPDSHELVTLYYGEDVKVTEAQSMADALGERYPGLSFEIVHGGQPHYHYILGVE